MKATQIIKSLEVASKADRPVMLWGGPGVGKSSVAKQFARKTDRKYIGMIATLIDPIDLRWSTKVVDGKLVFSPPEFFPDEENCVLNIDDIVTAPPLVQASLYEVVLDKVMGGVPLPKGTVIIATGNRENDRAAVNRMPTPLANRFIHLDFEFDNKDWELWALENNIAIEVIAFNRFRPALINQFNPVSVEKAQSTPRTWEFVSDIVLQKPDTSILYDLIKGTVGEASAIEFYSFLEDWELLPNPKEILNDPLKAIIPEKPSVLFALGAALAKMVDESTIDNFMVYANSLKENGLTDHAIAMISDATSRNDKLKETFGYTTWITNNGQVYAS